MQSLFSMFGCSLIETSAWDICEGRTWPACLHVEISLELMTHPSLQDQDCKCRCQIVFSHCLCLAPIAGFQLLLVSHKIFVWPELKQVSKFVLLMSFVIDTLAKVYYSKYVLKIYSGRGGTMNHVLFIVNNLSNNMAYA